MYLYNITFMMERSEERHFLSWLRADALPPATGYRRHRLCKVVAVPDDPEFSSQALSISLQVEFPSLAAARDWGKTLLPSLLDGFHKEISGHTLHFQSVLKSL